MLTPGRLYNFYNGQNLSMINAEIVNKHGKFYKQYRNRFYLPQFIMKSVPLFYVCEDYVEFEITNAINSMLIFISRGNFLAICKSDEKYAKLLKL